MTNEVNEQIARMNEIAQGPLVVASSRECYQRDTGLRVVFTTTVREGANSTMINDTKRHFLYAAKMVAEGRHIAVTDEVWNKRTEYEPVSARHGEPRVCIYGDVTVKRDTDTVTLSVNKFTEYTTALDMANHLYLVAECVKFPATCHASAQQPPALTTAQAREALGTGGQRRVGEPATSVPAPIGQSASGTPEFYQFPQTAETRAAFGDQYAGQVVSFTARKVEKKFHADPDENGQPQLEWLFYEKESHQYPMVRSTLAYIRDEATKVYLPKLPNTIEGEWRVVCYVNKKDTGKVYFNINKVEPVNVPHGDLNAPLTPHTVVPNDVDLRAVFPNDPFAGDADLSSVPPMSAADEIPF